MRRPGECIGSLPAIITYVTALPKLRAEDKPVLREAANGAGLVDPTGLRGLVIAIFGFGFGFARGSGVS